MHRHAIAAALILAAATACTSSSNGSDSKPSPSSSSLAAEWAPKLEAAAKADTGICNQAGDEACADHLTDIALAVTDLEQAVTEAGGKDSYPRTVAEIGKVNDAVEAYTKHECLGDENASIEGSPCPDDARTILAGGSALTLSLEADEAKN
jgi:hypothetical protein